MEIHRSSLIYSPRNKGPQPVGKIQRAENKTSLKTQQSVEVTFSNNSNSSKTDLTPANIGHALKQTGTKPVLSSIQFDTTENQPINMRIQKALIAYNTEQNQIPPNNSAQIVSSVDYIV
jgi:hypothetical protein